MSATVVLDSKGSEDTKVVIRPDLKRNGNPKPSDEEIARCGPLRMVIVVLFCLGLIGMLVAAIVIIAISPKCVPKPKSVPVIWWKKDLYYSIHVPSFQDTNINGFGDLAGVSRRVPYLKEIGAKTVVLSGVVDQNDLSNVDLNVGTVDDLKALVKTLKSNGIRVIVSFNPTYTTLTHHWFNASRTVSSKERTYYIWNNKQANNWKNEAGNSAWEFDSKSKEYFYSFYGPQVASLNYSNPEVRKALSDTLKRWIVGFGVNGFYLDGVSRLVVDHQLRSTSATTDYSKDQPGSHVLLKELNQLVSKHGAILIGSPLSSNLKSYFGTSADKELHVVLNNYFATSKALQSGSSLNTTILSYIAQVPAFAWPGWLIGGSGFSRVTSRLSAAKAKLVNIMLLTLPGTIAPFYGDELLLKDKDLKSTSIMQWNGKKHAGFSNATRTWLMPHTDYKVNNVENDKKGNGTVMTHIVLAALRAKEKALSGPQFDVLYAAGNTIVYIRSYQGSDSYIVALNFGSSTVTNISLANKKIGLDKGHVVYDTKFLLTGKDISLTGLSLADGQGLVIKVIEGDKE